MTDTPVVRTATAEDEEELMTLCRMLWGEIGVFSLDEDKVRKAIKGALTKPTVGYIGVIGEPGKIEAMLFLTLYQHWYTSDWVLSEMFNFCHPDYRRTDNARALIEYAKGEADKLHIPLMMGILSNKRTEGKVRLYQKQLGKPSGAFFVYGDNNSPKETTADV